MTKSKSKTNILYIIHSNFGDKKLDPTIRKVSVGVTDYGGQHPPRGPRINQRGHNRTFGWAK